MDWTSNKSIIENILLAPIMNFVLEVKLSLGDIFSIHIYKEYNTRAYHLSKEVVPMQEGSLLIQEFRERLKFP